MTALLPHPSPTSVSTRTPRPMRWTCEQFHQLGDMGVFEGRRAMLIHGEILEEGPMNPPHAIAVELVEEVIREALGKGWRVRCQLPLILGLDTDPEPDVAIIAGSARGKVDHPTTAELVIEIADTSLDFDLQVKRLLYARAEIREYWVLDINGRQLHVFREPQAGDYPVGTTHGVTDTVSPLSVPTAVVKVADLLPG